MARDHAQEPASPSSDDRAALRWVALGAAFVGALLIAATVLALRAQDQVFPSLVVDPFGSFSGASLPSWRADSLPLRFPDRLIAIDGAPLSREVGYGRFPAQRATSELARRVGAGQKTARLTFETRAGRVVVDRPLRVFGFGSVVYFFFFYAAMALFVAWSGAAALLLADKRGAGRAYAQWALGVACFMITFFDYHSSAALAPVFSMASAWTALGYFRLAYSFPSPPREGRLRGLWDIAIRVCTWAGVAAVAWLALAPFIRQDPWRTRYIVGFMGPVAALVLAVSITVRYVSSDGVARRELRAALLGIGGIVAVLGIGVLLTMVTGTPFTSLILPFLIPLVPLSIGYALVRYNILGTSAVLTGRLLAFPIVFFSAVVSMSAWLALRSRTSSTMNLMIPASVSLGTFAWMSINLRRLAQRLLFPAAAQFRPTIQQLAESLTDLDQRHDLRAALERTVTKWLPSDRVRLRMPSELDEIDRLPANAVRRLGNGEHLWTDLSPRERHLLVPMRSLGVLRGVLDISPKHQGALFTEEDLALLDTISSLGAIALHNTETLEALNEMRRLEVDATREDKRLTLGLLGAELSHEIAHPLQFFRAALRRGAKRLLAPEDLEIGEEEIERLERLLASLRRLEPAPPHVAAVHIAEPVERAMVLVRERLVVRGLRSRVDLPEGCVVLADADGLLQVFANLLRNATQVARHAVGVHAQAQPDGSLTIDVWDDGPGVPEEFVDKLFHRWVTSRSSDGGSGLGLSIAQRLVASFDWNIQYLRDEGRTCFRMTVPRKGVVTAAA